MNKAEEFLENHKNWKKYSDEDMVELIEFYHKSRILEIKKDVIHKQAEKVTDKLGALNCLTYLSAINWFKEELLKNAS